MKFGQSNNIAKRHYCKSEREFHRVKDRNEIGKVVKKRDLGKNIAMEKYY